MAPGASARDEDRPDDGGKAGDPVGWLRQLSELHAQRLITQKEYDEKRREILEHFAADRRQEHYPAEGPSVARHKESGMSMVRLMAFVGGGFLMVLSLLQVYQTWPNAELVGWLVAAIAGYIIMMVSLSRRHFCADCGQFVASTPAVPGLRRLPPACSRCGCNRYVLEPAGVGRTIRQR